MTNLKSAVYIIFIILLSITAYGEKTMKSLYELGWETKVIEDVFIKLKPQKMILKKDDIIDIFPVPFDNAVGTDDFDDYLTLIEFDIDKGKIVYEELDIKVGRNWAMHTLPVFSKNKIGYASDRGFTIVDFKRKESKHFIWIAQGFEEHIRKVRIADAEKSRFIFYIQRFLGSDVDYHYFLRLIDCSGEKAKVLKEIQTYVNETDSFTWFEIANNKLLLFEGPESLGNPRKKLTILDSDFKPSNYPILEKIFKNNKGNLYTSFYNQHVNLPFAIVDDKEGYDQILLLKEHTVNFPLISLYNHSATEGILSFSQDGKWLITQLGYDHPERYKFYLFPISEKYPFYIGSPIDTGIETRGDHKATNVAWTTNPTAFIATYYNGEIYRVGLGNEENFNMTKGKNFHEYIVELDLKENKERFKEQRKFLNELEK